MELDRSTINTYSKIAKRARGFVVIAKHQVTAPAMMGGRLPESMEAAQEAAAKFLAKPAFTNVWIVTPTGEVTEVTR